MDYTMPRADDLPMSRSTTCVTPCTHNPLGVKGCGEAGAIGSPPAVVNAVIDALQRGGIPMSPYRHAGLALAGLGGDQRLRGERQDVRLRIRETRHRRRCGGGAGAEGAQALSGGQTLIPTMKQRLAAPGVLVSLTGIAEMQGVCMGTAGCTSAAPPRHAVVAREAAKHYPALAALAGGIGDPAVRNRGTIGGSLANNDPAACYPAAVLGSGATVVTNKRRIAADDYFQGMFTTALERARSSPR
jgi:hypothetical protein